MKDGHPPHTRVEAWHCRGPMSRAESRAAGWVARWLEANCTRVVEYDLPTADDPADEPVPKRTSGRGRRGADPRFGSRVTSGRAQDFGSAGLGGRPRSPASERPGDRGAAEATDVVRTQRVEVLDEDGRVRIAIGMLGVGEGPMFGLKVVDETGRDRIWALHDGPLAEVALDFGGDTAAALTVDDWGEASLFLGEED